ncbi:MAG: 1-(5-phosphoribosyl)-5-amino-4-imidazole-carboxylate carboxylase, partial [Clostridiales bacterium]|nr:1-(5-phosphoribosyl)-5-amino-4-imidazole-carboxylate carboxylase [Clostridiales bacterium]
MDIRKLLAGVKEGEVSLEEAEQVLRRAPLEEMGFAKLDTHRELRSGFPEVIFCAGKPDTFLVDIYRRMAEENGSA